MILTFSLSNVWAPHLFILKKLIFSLKQYYYGTFSFRVFFWLQKHQKVYNLLKH